MSNLPTKPHHIKRFNDMPTWAQYLIAYPNIRKLWLPALPVILSIAFSAITASPFGLILGLVGSGAYIAASLRTIAEKDGAPQFGLLEVLGLRLPIVLDEGLNIIIPFISKIVLRSKEQINQDIEVKGIRCRLEAMPTTKKTFYASIAQALRTPSPPDIESGGSVGVTLGLTVERDWNDGWSVLDYDNAGETKQVVKILTDRIEEDLREIGRRLNWLQLSFATDLTAVHIVMSLTGFKKYRGKPIFEDPTPEYIQDLMDEVKVNGVSYVGGLGLKIRRLQVKNISPEGKLATEADTAAVEDLRRVGMLRNTRAIAEAIDIYRSKLTDKTMTDKDITNLVLINDPDARVQKDITEVNITGLDNVNIKADDIGKVAAALSQLFGKKKGK